jgi:hypothetical protein
VSRRLIDLLFRHKFSHRKVSDPIFFLLRTARVQWRIVSEGELVKADTFDTTLGDHGDETLSKLRIKRRDHIVHTVRRPRRRSPTTMARNISNWIVQSRRQLAGKQAEITKIVESYVSVGQKKADSKSRESLIFDSSPVAVLLRFSSLIPTPPDKLVVNGASSGEGKLVELGKSDTVDD